MSRVIDMTGKTYGNLVAIKVVGKASNGNAIWLFKCSCGDERVADGYVVRIGVTVNCLKCSREVTRKTTVTHGMSETVEFYAWTDMKTRCFNSNSTSYNNYGGRGVKVCDRWVDSFENFYSDMGGKPTPLHSIDRINVDGDYEPSNCRWATNEEQANNKRNNIK